MMVLMEQHFLGAEVCFFCFVIFPAAVNHRHASKVRISGRRIR